MSRRLFFRCFIFLALALCVPAADGRAAVLVSGGSPVAVRTFGVWDQENNERFDFAVYYPGGSSDAMLIREGRRIEASHASRILPGFYPVILLSHDTAGSRFANGDLAVAMAAKGFVVVAPTHAGDNQNNSDMLYSAELVMNRPRQMLRALDTLLGTPEFAPHVDESRIGLLGVGFGGITVMQLAGAKPDFSVLDEYCRPFNGQTVRDPFCVPWVGERLGRLPQAMAALEKTQEKNAFTPELDLFAPALEPTPAVSELPPPPAPEEGEKKGGAWGERTFLQRIFNLAPEPEKTPGPREEEAQAESLPPVVNATAPWDSLLDFQEHPFFSKTEVSDAFVPKMDTMLQRYALTDESVAVASPPPPSARPSAPPVYRRPASVRRIGAIGLAMPAGGMLFSRESLEKVHVPVALVTAEEDGLYKPAKHAQPYAELLRGQALVLNLPGVDHFSLFAPCNKELATNLGDVCGRLVGDDREKAAEARDAFFASFFQSVLGEVKALPEPSGLVAVKEHSERQRPGSRAEARKETGEPTPGAQAAPERGGRERSAVPPRRAAR